MAHIEANTVVLTALAVTTLVNGILARKKETKAVAAAVEVKNTLADTSKAVADRAAEVKTALTEASAKTDRKLEAIRQLVNSKHGIALTNVAVALEKIAEMTKKPKDIGLAKAARELSDDHDRQQKELNDSGGSQ